ncbi:MAG: T9SS type A sorting domain-containing protein, partial [Flavobacteriales bacterium]
GGSVVNGQAGYSSYSYSIANCSLSQLSGTNEGNGSVRIIGPHVAIDTVNTPGPNYTWAANGVSYQHSGTYSYADIDNCIIRVLDLSIGGLGGCLNYTTIDTTITSCGSYTSELNGRTYTENATDSIRVGCVKYLVKLIVAPPAELLGNMITGGSSQSGMVACNDSEHTYSISPVPYATSYEWTLPSGATGTSSTNSITVQFGNDFNGGSICVTPMNECGSGENICKMIYPAAPFPSGDIIQISAPQAPYISGNYAATEVFGATTYTWSVSNNEAVIVSGQGTPNIQLEAAPGIIGLTTLSVVAENCLGSETSASIILVDAVSVEEEEMVVVDGITLYPNPSKGQFTLSTPSLREDAVLEVYSMEGRLVYQTNIPANTNQTFIDLQQPSAGLYAVRLLAGNKLSSMKIIVN